VGSVGAKKGLLTFAEAKNRLSNVNDGFLK
jgi:hypothetical protein